MNRRNKHYQQANAGLDVYIAPKIDKTELARAEASLVVREFTEEEKIKYGEPVPRKGIKIPFMGWGTKQ